MKSVGAEASLERKIEFLLQRDQEAQEEANQFRARLDAVECGSAKRLEELREGMERHVAESLVAAHEQYLPLRLLGAAVLFVGVGCATAANFP